MTKKHTKRLPARRSAEAKSLSLFRRRRWRPVKGKGSKYNRAATKQENEHGSGELGT